MHKNSYFQKYHRNDKKPYFDRIATKNITAYYKYTLRYKNALKTILERCFLQTYSI